MHRIRGWVTCECRRAVVRNYIYVVMALNCVVFFFSCNFFEVNYLTVLVCLFLFVFIGFCFKEKKKRKKNRYE